MSIPLDKFEKMRQDLDKSLLMTEVINQQISSVDNIMNSISSNPTFLSDASILSATISEEVINSMELAEKLANQLAFSPIFSFSSEAYEITAKIIDPVSCVFTPNFCNLAAEIVKMPISSFEYSFDDAGNVTLSEQLEDKLSNIIDVKIKTSDSHKKIISKEFFRNVILPIVLALLQLGYSAYSNAQSTELAEQYHQEEMAIQRQILNENQKQTEYLGKICESFSNSVPAEKDSPFSQTDDN